jgi:acetolactate decarboxylase
MKKITTLAALLILIATSARAGGIYQYSTIDALLAGRYDGDLSMDQLLKRGGFGLGTLNGLDGELVVLDGKAYHVQAGGEVVTAEPSDRTPFATVTTFEEDSIASLDAVSDLGSLNKAMLDRLVSENFFHAVRIEGRFEMIKTRAIPAQTKPYRPLVEAMKDQVIVKFTGLEGTLVGLWTPGFMKGVNVPGFHWHFISDDGTRGGHVLDVSFDKLVARIDVEREFSMTLPEFLGGVDLSPDRSEALHKVEKDPAE